MSCNKEVQGKDIDLECNRQKSRVLSKSPLQGMRSNP